MFRFNRRTKNAVLSGACASLLMLSATAPRVLAQNNQTVFGYGITENKKGVPRLVTLSAKTSKKGAETSAKNLSKISGLQSGERLLGIDFRPATGELFALGSSSRLYTLTINGKNVQATAVGGSSFSIPLNGTFFGFDFNPTVDRIRVVSDTDQNLRLNPITGGVVDRDLTTDGVQSDGTLDYTDSDANPFIAGAAYTNPDNDAATGTTLYYIDSGRDVLAVSPGPAGPNAGTLTTVGSLGIDVSVPLSFDISVVNGVNIGVATFVTSTDPKRVSIANIDLTTGKATVVGRVKSDDALTGIALLPAS